MIVNESAGQLVALVSGLFDQPCNYGEYMV